MYIAIDRRTLDHQPVHRVLPALLQAEARMVGVDGDDDPQTGHVIAHTEFAPNSELWDACGLDVLATGESRDQVERFLAAREADEEERRAVESPLHTVDFGSDDAYELAGAAGLAAEDFEGIEPAGPAGIGIDQVRELMLVAADQEDVPAPPDVEGTGGTEPADRQEGADEQTPTADSNAPTPEQPTEATPTPAETTTEADTIEED